MLKIAVFTGTRAEYGLLYWLMKAIQADNGLQLQIIVSGAHLSPHFGETWKEIEADGFCIDAKVEMLLSSDTSVGVIKSMGLASIGMADALSRLTPDRVVILGDRYEALAFAQSALIMGIPIVHIHGGELSFGAYDDAIRHAISKMAVQHFVSCEPYRKRVIQMGEDPSRVHNVGALGLEHLEHMERCDFNVLLKDLNIPLARPFFLVTYHPTTADHNGDISAFTDVLKVLEDIPTHQVLFTYPNADNGGHAIIEHIERYCQIHPTQAFAVKSLGHHRYLNVAAYADTVIGNSSSAIIEIPSLGIPSVNIGARQKGRIAASSVLHCEGNYSALKKTLHQALDPEFRNSCRHTVNPYGSGQIAQKIIPFLKKQSIPKIKTFQDWDFDYAKS